MGSRRQKYCLSRNKMACVLSFALLSCIEENLIVLIAFYSLDHLTKHFRSIALKSLRKCSFSRMLKGQSFTKSIPHCSLRQVLLDIRVANSNLAKSLSEKSITMQCTKMKTHTQACYPCKINKTNHFPPILVTSIQKTDSF